MLTEEQRFPAMTAQEMIDDDSHLNHVKEAAASQRGSDGRHR
jgi:hypothetical protein